MPECSVLNKAWPQGKLVHQSLTLLTWNGNTQLQPTQAIMSHLQGRKTTDTLVKCTVPRHGLIETLIPNHMTMEYFSTPHHHITKVLFTVIPFTWYINLTVMKKLQGIPKVK